jgi:hypothetical protein
VGAGCWSYESAHFWPGRRCLGTGGVGRGDDYTETAVVSLARRRAYKSPTTRWASTSTGRPDASWAVRCRRADPGPAGTRAEGDHTRRVSDLSRDMILASILGPGVGPAASTIAYSGIHRLARLFQRYARRQRHSRAPLVPGRFRRLPATGWRRLEQSSSEPPEQMGTRSKPEPFLVPRRQARGRWR